MTYADYLAECKRRRDAYQAAQARGRAAITADDWRAMVAAERECNWLWVRILDLSTLIAQVDDWPKLEEMP